MEARPHLFLWPTQHPSIKEEGSRPSSHPSFIEFFFAPSFCPCSSGVAVQSPYSGFTFSTSVPPPLLNLRPSSIRRMIWAGGTSDTAYRKHIICEAPECLVIYWGSGIHTLLIQDWDSICHPCRLVLLSPHHCPMGTL